MSAKHLKSLLLKSAKVQREIEREQRRRMPDWLRLLKLKKVRLVIKDRIHRISTKGKQMRSDMRLNSVLAKVDSRTPRTQWKENYE